MLTVQVEQLGKRFNREWIFRHVNLKINPGDKLVITGANGSGKSTLLLVLSGYMMSTEGKISWSDSAQNQIPSDKIYRKLSIVSPAMELIEEFNPIELIKHQRNFRDFQNDFSDADILELAMLSANKNKIIKNFSSGMKQRLKLTLATLTDSSLMLLDEPIINLDYEGIKWYKKLISTYAESKTIVVCSNKIQDEYEFCNSYLSIDDYKTTTIKK